MKDERKVEFDLFGVIPGDRGDEYLAYACWKYARDDPEEIVSGIFQLKTSPDKIEWDLLFRVETWVNSIYRFNAECYILGASVGELIEVKNGKRKEYKTGQFSGVGSIWGANENDFWIANDEGLSHWDGEKISRNFRTEWTNLIHPTGPNSAIAVGAKGVVLRHERSEWHKVDSVPTNRQLVTIHRASDSEIYVGGWDGVLYRWDGLDHWEKIDVIDKGEIITPTIYSIAKYMEEVYVAVGSPGLFKIECKKATKVKPFFSIRTAVVNGKLIITGSDSLVEFNGVDWMEVTISP